MPSSAWWSLWRHRQVNYVSNSWPVAVHVHKAPMWWASTCVDLHDMCINPFHKWYISVHGGMPGCQMVGSGISYFQTAGRASDWLIDWAWFNVCTNTIYVIRPTVFTGLMTQPTVSKHWRRVVSHPDRPQSNHAHLTMLHGRASTIKVNTIL